MLHILEKNVHFLFYSHELMWLILRRIILKSKDTKGLTKYIL